MEDLYDKLVLGVHKSWKYIIKYTVFYVQCLSTID